MPKKKKKRKLDEGYIGCVSLNGFFVFVFWMQVTEINPSFHQKQWGRGF
jgi:hypothetical protein